MVFAYYKRLNAAQKSIYRRSNQIQYLQLLAVAPLLPYVSALQTALQNAERQKVEQISQDLLHAIVTQLNVPLLRVKVLARRPLHNWGELHGLYELAEGRKRAVIKVWMRTAQRHQVVAFRTFLRTLLHELCHHLDYEYLELADSFHTEGFYKREASLFRQLMVAQ